MCVQASLAAIGAAVGVSKQVVGAWRQGKKVPGAAARAQLEARYGIPAAAWTQRPNGARPSSAPPPSPPPADAPSSTMGRLDQLLGLVRAGGTADLLPAERVKLAEAEAKLLSLRHRMEKESEILDERIVKEHPMWQKIKAAIGDTLVAWPDAARAVAAKLKELGA